MPTLSSLAWILILTSFLILVLGSWAYILSSARTLVMNTLFGSICMLFAAYQQEVKIHAQTRAQIDAHEPWTYILPFLVTMLFLGRAIGLAIRSRKEADWIPSSRIIIALTLVCALATASAYWMKAG